MLKRVFAEIVSRFGHGTRGSVRGVGPLSRQAADELDAEQPDRALDTVRAAISRRPASNEAPRLTAAAHTTLGTASRKRGQLDAAAASLEAALALQPDDHRAWNELGIVHLERGNIAAARHSFERALALVPELAEAHCNLGIIALDEMDSGRAKECLHRALILDPGLTAAHCNLGIIALDEMDFERAIDCLKRALALDPELTQAYCNLGLALYNTGRIAESERLIAEALERNPGNALARLYSSFSLLARGEWRSGWERFEARLDGDHPTVRFLFPRWHGEPVAGKRILVCGEQGLGDHIMFTSCLPDLIACGAHCALALDLRLTGLLQRSFPQAEVLHEDDFGRPRAFDYQIPVGSLPRQFRNTASDFPEHLGYLQADPQRVAYWKGRLNALGDGMKIGISWRGGTLNTRRILRSIDLENLALPLCRQDRHFISLQYTDCRAELDAMRAAHGVTVHHWPEAIADYDETAALICALDLVVSVCTSVVHLAGALGQRVWVVVPSIPEWRYGFEGEAMPWYPSLRVFRQPPLRGWQPVIDRVAAELQRFASTASCGRPLNGDQCCG